VRQRLVSIFLLTLACAAATWTAFARPPGRTDGSYNCIVAGDFTGEGKVSSNGNGSSLSFDIQVRDKAGNVGQLVATVNVINNRFAGDGSVMGLPMKIQGRLDPADQGREQLRGQRLVATFRDNSKHHGRITGSPRLRGNGNGGQGGPPGGGDD
jgi:hypothetical protein